MEKNVLKVTTFIMEKMILLTNLITLINLINQIKMILNLIPLIKMILNLKTKLLVVIVATICVVVALMFAGNIGLLINVIVVVATGVMVNWIMVIVMVNIT